MSVNAPRHCPNHLNCAVPPMCSFLILFIPVTPRQALIKQTRFSKLCRLMLLIDKLHVYLLLIHTLWSVITGQV